MLFTGICRVADPHSLNVDLTPLFSKSLDPDPDAKFFEKTDLAYQ